MKKELIGCVITEEEHKRLNELKEIFSATSMSGVFEPALAYVAEHKEIEVKAQVRNKDAVWKRMSFVLKPEVSALLERYSLANFRDLTNTLRFLINASYENITISRE